jgi:endonuclease YncB( thermonuclease family)
MNLNSRWFAVLVSGFLLTCPAKANSLAEAMGAYNAEDFATAVQMLVPLVKTYGDKATRSVLLMVYRRWQGSPTCTPEMLGQVQSVTDGDTLKIKYGDGKLVTVRLFAADAPETKQAFGDVAKKRLNVLVGNREVCVQPNGEDRYHRQLGVVWTSAPECDHSTCPKVLDAGMTLIAEGLA